jgi:hypothetical protein
MLREHRRMTRRRVLARLRLRLRTVLETGRRRHVADVRFYQLLTDADRRDGADAVEADLQIGLGD